MGVTVPTPSTSKHHNLIQVGVYVDGEQISRKPLFPNFDAAGGQNVIASYPSLFSGIRIKKWSIVPGLIHQNNSLLS